MYFHTIDSVERVKGEVHQYLINQASYFVRTDPVFCAQFPSMCRLAYDYGRMCQKVLQGLERMKRPSKAGSVPRFEVAKALMFTIEKSVERVEGLIRKIAILSKEGELSEGRSFEDDGSESGDSDCEGGDESSGSEE